MKKEKIDIYCIKYAGNCKFCPKYRICYKEEKKDESKNKKLHLRISNKKGNMQ